MNQNSGLMKTAIIAVISALIGGGVAYAGFSKMGNAANDVTTTTQTPTKAGATKISNIKVNSSSQTTTAFQKVNTSVVSVVNLQKQQQSTGDLSELFGSGTLSGNKSNAKSNSSDLEESSEGSGLIYEKKDGKAYIVTNNHVVADSDKVEVILSDGTKLEATLVGTDAISDLAVLKIDGAKVKKTATFGDSDSIKAGESVLAIGSPLGSEYATSVTQGIISAKKRTIDVTDETTGQATVIQTDTAINPGNSGGPLVNMAGQVVGINSMKLASNGDTTVEGMGFAIPSNEVVKIINQLVANGKVVRPALGISVIDLTNISSTQQSSVLKLPSTVNSGVVVASVTSNSVAKKAGISKYDVIVGLGGKTVSSVADLHTILYSYAMNSTTEIQYYHNGSLKKANVKLTQAASSDSTTTTK
ncbi:PDZ domain-containing protein [Latilactobacillus sakei]|uniref:S1C family serine protease n=1 Tax=Latilactobacillus sakei TaxID=1599 RepID=UPI00033A9517|nr:trypsin-like peptidase domain-containing protein [Latilactobacillus sakei]EOR85916.1 serine protease, DegP/HtrA, do-like [Latilactobacillus sakei subsp. sakei LS25]PKX63619.1 PDZ domain-containing protein [Latilactobacillus sakei]PKX69137.1 PDZ domain-containing protein [Latilactobacillus sakei]